MMAWVYMRYGREPGVDYSERYEREPPTDDPPAVVSAIMGQKPSVGTREFTATLFDLIRRGVLEAQPVSVKQGGLLGEKTITDLRIDAGNRDRGEDYERNIAELKDFERRVLNVALRVLHNGPVNLTDFEERIEEDGEANRSSYNAFTEDLKRDVEGRDLVERSAGRWLLPIALLLGLFGVVWFLLSLFGLNLWAVIGLAISNAFFLIIGIAIFWFVLRRILAASGSALNQLWVRRTSKGALLHARWRAFRQYLTDFSRMQEAAPASLALWEQFLVYGIALGVAEQVLDARLQAPLKWPRAAASTARVTMGP